MFPLSPTSSVRLFLAAWIIGVVVLSAHAAPDFAISGRAEELGKAVLARDGAEEITALDVLLFLDMDRRNAVRVPVPQWLGTAKPADPKAQAEIQRATEEYIAARRLAAGSVGRPAPDFVSRSLTHTAAIAAFVQTQIVDAEEIAVTQTDIHRYFIAHPELYSSDSRAEVRYIYLPVLDMSVAVDLIEAEAQMAEIKTRIATGDMTFAEAANQFSQAPSAVAGGLIPEFAAGTHFSEFDFQSFNIRNPGDMSPVFVGNDGVYLIQLVSKTPPSKTPINEAESEIRTRLEHDLAGPYYRFLSGKLAQDSFVQNFSALWGYADLDAPVAILDGSILSRDQVLRLNPRVINASYQPQPAVIQAETARWLEGERILRALEAKNLGDHPYIQRARQIASTLIASREALRRSVGWDKVATQDSAMKTLGMGGDAPPGVRQARVIQITLAPDDASMSTAGTAEVVRNTMRALGQTIMAGRLPTRPEELEFANRLTEAYTKAEGDKEFRDVIGELRSEMDQSPWENIAIRIQDLDWQDAAYGIAEQPALPDLQPGEISSELTIGNRSTYLLVVAERYDTESDWLQSPMFLRAVAFESEKQKTLNAAAAEVRKANLYLRTP